MPRTLILVSLLTAWAAAGAMRAHADDPCLGFKWDVARERALFGGTPVALSAGKDAASAPVIVAGRLYALRLIPQSTVDFAAAPGKQTPADGAYAGMAALKLPGAGDYRVSVDVPLWLDVAAGGKLAAVVDYQGLHSCRAPHKVVEFALTGVRQFLLQVSGSGETLIHVTVTKAPPTT